MRTYTFIIAAALLWLGSMFSTSALQAQPANDDACNAVGLTVNGTASSTYTTTGATTQPGETTTLLIPGSGGEGNDGWFTGDVGIQNSVWFSFVAPPLGGVNVDLCSQGLTDFDSQIAIFEADTCVSFTNWTIKAANDDAPGGCGSASSLFASNMNAICLTPGETYYLMVDGYGGEEGNFVITLTEINGAPATPLIISTGLTTPPDCPGGTNGVASVNVTGGLPPYAYLWDNNTTDQVNAGLAAGTYQVFVGDRCDTVKLASVTIGTRDSLIADAGAEASACAGDSVMMGSETPGTGGRPNISERAFGMDLFDGLFVRHTVERADAFTTESAAITNSHFAGDFFLGAFWAIDFTADQLVVVDTSSATVVPIGPCIPLPDHTFVGMAFNSQDQQVYALSNEDTDWLYTIDISSGTATPSVPLLNSTGVPIWLAIDSAGNAYYADIIDDQLYSLDLSTGASSAIGPLGVDIGFAQDADFDPETNELYMMAYGGDLPTAELRRVNVTTGASELISLYGNDAEVGAWAIAPESVESYTYAWSPAAGVADPTSAMTMVSPAVQTTYTLTITDQCGAVATETVTISLNEPPALTVGAESDDGTGTGVAYVTAASEALPLTYLWSNGAETDTISGLTPGDYIVIVTDALGCQSVDTVTVGGVGINDLEAFASLTAYPNPAQTSLTVDLQMQEAQEVQISLLDVTGKAVRQANLGRSLTVKHVMDVADLSTGVYMLRVRTAQGQAYRKVVISN